MENQYYPPAAAASSSSSPTLLFPPQNNLFTPSPSSSSSINLFDHPHPPPGPHHHQVQIPPDIGLLSGDQPAGDLLTTHNNHDQAADHGEEIRDTNRRKGGASSSRNHTRTLRRPRVAFYTRSADDILDDGFCWRNVKKQVQRLSNDTSIVVTTYEGVHNHPCEKLMEALIPLLKQMQFLSARC